MSIDTFLLSSDTTDLNYPEVRPTLDLNFARVKALDPRITFTRASGGSYVGADGLIKYAGVNEPRFDHDPYTGESLGFLVEGSRTNLTTYSQQFDDAAWTKTNVTVTANATTAPDGTNTALHLKETNINPFNGYVAKFYDTFTPGTYTASVFAKGDGSGRLLNFVLYQGSYQQSYFNLTTGVVSNVDASLTASIQAFPNGWFRCSVTGTSVTFTTSLFYIAAAAGENSVYGSGRAGSASAGIYLWGAQLETRIPAGVVTLLGLGPTSYIPTEASTRTRAADNATITGTNFSSWYNTIKGGGTIFTRYADNLVKDTLFGHTFSFDGGGVRWLSNWGSYQVYDGIVAIGGNPPNNRTSPVSEAGALEVTADGIARQSVARNGIVFVQNGGKVRITGMTQLSIGYSSNTLQYLTGTFSRLTYWPKKLTDAQLQVLTR